MLFRLLKIESQSQKLIVEFISFFVMSLDNLGKLNMLKYKEDPNNFYALFTTKECRYVICLSSNRSLKPLSFMLFYSMLRNEYGE